MTEDHETNVQKALRDIADRQGVSLAAAEHLFSALVAGGGYQAQFNHPELGGMGQWSSGGMLMIGDMFNHGLKAKVAALCSDLADLVNRSPVLQPSFGQHQSQYQGSGEPQPYLQAASGSNWWPGDLGQPTATGAQNDMRYAVFPASRRLALSVGGDVTVYDTRDHMIGGFSQQQSGDASITFTSQHGRIDLSDLEKVSAGGGEKEPPADTTPAPIENPMAYVSPSKPQKPVDPQAASDTDIFDKIERLAALHAKGILTDQEFEATKRELLARL